LKEYKKYLPASMQMQREHWQHRMKMLLALGSGVARLDVRLHEYACWRICFSIGLLSACSNMNVLHHFCKVVVMLDSVVNLASFPFLDEASMVSRSALGTWNCNLLPRVSLRVQGGGTNAAAMQ
jgi:hypothetical protein